MSWKTKASATAAGKAAQAKLPGKDWKLTVWENLGWHWNLQQGPLLLFSHLYKGKERFSTMFHRDCTGTGDMRYSSDRSFPTPLAAVRYQLKLVREIIEQEAAQLLGIEIDMEKYPLKKVKKHK